MNLLDFLFNLLYPSFSDYFLGLSLLANFINVWIREIITVGIKISPNFVEFILEIFTSWREEISMASALVYGQQSFADEALIDEELDSIFRK